MKKTKTKIIIVSLPLLARIEKMDCFAHCGEPLSLNLDVAYRYVSDLKTAIKECASHDWENATLDARNILTAYLSTYHPQEDRYWNSLAINARQFIQEKVAPRLETAFDGSLPKTCLNSIQWDIHSAIMEDAYSFLGHPFTFFAQLLQIYEAGHFPCGWTGGEYPNGKLLIY